MKNIKDTINKLVYNVIVSNKGINMANITVNWHQIVGEELSESCHPVKITEYKSRDKNLRTLSIHVKNQAIAMVVQYKKDSIVNKANMSLGYKAIDKVKVSVDESLWK